VGRTGAGSIAAPGAWPKVSVWHGDADTAVKPVNAEEIIKQWADMHGLDLQPTIQMTVDGYPRRVWQGPDGDELIESYTVTGMSHGAALDPGAEPHQCGTAAPFFNAVGISSTHRIADFWGLLAERPASAKDPASRAGSWEECCQCSGCREHRRREPIQRGERVVNDENAADAGQGYASGPQDQRRATGRPFGLDVHGIISASLEAAGLLKAGRSRRTDSTAPLGIDVPGIISTALEAAGVLKGVAQRVGSARPRRAV
jgi:hypothetical protein